MFAPMATSVSAFRRATACRASPRKFSPSDETGYTKDALLPRGLAQPLHAPAALAESLAVVLVPPSKSGMTPAARTAIRNRTCPRRSAPSSHGLLLAISRQAMTQRFGERLRHATASAGPRARYATGRPTRPHNRRCADSGPGLARLTTASAPSTPTARPPRAPRREPRAPADHEWPGRSGLTRITGRSVHQIKQSVVEVQLVEFTPWLRNRGALDENRAQCRPAELTARLDKAQSCFHLATNPFRPLRFP
jgi:hypothetical protein